MTTSLTSRYSTRSLYSGSTTGGSGSMARSMAKRAVSLYGSAGGYGVRISSVGPPISGINHSSYGTRCPVCHPCHHGDYSPIYNHRHNHGIYPNDYFGPDSRHYPGIYPSQTNWPLQIWPPMDNGKLVLVILNQRLSNYLNQVSHLEKANIELELKISQFLESRMGPSSSDHTAYLATIADLKAKIQAANLTNAVIRQGTDSASLASEDFKAKYENELNTRLSVEADIGGLRNYLDQITMNIMHLEGQFEGLKEELIILKREHPEDLENLRANMSEVDVQCPALATSALLMEMGKIRDDYEAIVAKNLHDLETWYNAKMEEINNQVSTDKSSLQTSLSEINDVRRKFMDLEIEQTSVLAWKASRETLLTETRNRYNQMLFNLQSQVSSLEELINHLRTDMERQGQEFHTLLNIKAHLEMEIAEYRRLLEVKDVDCVDNSSLSSSSSITTVTRVVRVVEEVLEDGTVVSSTDTSGSLTST
ncbi:keratin, type I cytoskeletal 13-like [Stigmatopora nigra]